MIIGNSFNGGFGGYGAFGSPFGGPWTTPYGQTWQPALRMRRR
jgi:hypothetical protein